ncbi:MAG: radical SAM protein [Candidatus Hodarchaeota archaeon]
MRSRLVTHWPIFLSHMVTSYCDCKCRMCGYWKLGKREEMTFGQIQNMLVDALRVGMSDYLIWGGEPLLRQDTPEIIAYANNIGLDTTIITNGSFLAERIDKIAPNLWGIIVSLDHPNARQHDHLRRFPGLFDKAIEGIERAKRYRHLRIFINCVIQKENINQVQEMAEFAKDLGVRISYEMMEVIAGYNDKFLPTRKEIIQMSNQIIQMKYKGYPISNSSSYFRAIALRSPYSCQVPKICVTVLWDGTVRLCQTISEDVKPPLVTNCELGNVTQTSFRELFLSRNYQRFVRAAEKCWRCDLSYPREIALLDSYDPDAIVNLFTKIL